MKKLNNKGFGTVEVLLALIVIGIIGVVGWYVYKSNKDISSSNTTTTTNPATKISTPTTVYKVPDGYVTYENKELGFKFAYPKEYQPINKTTANDLLDYFVSAGPNQEYAPGVTGPISISTLPINQSFGTFKYGPDIKYEGGNLIVTSINPADNVNKTGGQYKYLDGTAAIVQKNGDLSIVTIKGDDEGTSHIAYVFTNKSKAIIINLPDYYDGTTLLSENNKANDPTKSNLMRKDILDSIQKL